MATRESATNVNSALLWVAGVLVTVTMALSGFSATQVLKTIDETKTAKNEEVKKQDEINKALNLKLDAISNQLSNIGSDYKIMQNTITKQEEDIKDLQKRVMELEIDKARRGGR